MNKMKCTINRLFRRYPKLVIDKNWEVYSKYWNLYIPKGYENPKIDFIKDWLDTPIQSNLFPYSRLNYVADPAALLDVYMRFSYDLFCYLRDNKYDMRSLNTYEKYVNQFNIKVPGFIKPVENE